MVNAPLVLATLPDNLFSASQKRHWFVMVSCRKIVDKDLQNNRSSNFEWGQKLGLSGFFHMNVVYSALSIRAVRAQESVSSDKSAA
jgi:hypothetical protein